MKDFWPRLVARARQPSTLMAMGCLLGALVYWMTKDPSLTLVAISIIPGALNDHTRLLISKVEAVEDGLRENTIATVRTNRSVNTLTAAEHPTDVITDIHVSDGAGFDQLKRDFSEGTFRPRFRP